MLLESQGSSYLSPVSFVDLGCRTIEIIQRSEGFWDEDVFGLIFITLLCKVIMSGWQRPMSRKIPLSSGRGSSFFLSPLEIEVSPQFKFQVLFVVFFFRVCTAT